MYINVILTTIKSTLRWFCGFKEKPQHITSYACVLMWLLPLEKKIKMSMNAYIKR